MSIADTSAAPTVRHTIATPCMFEGRGLHTGNACRVRVAPAPAGAGVRLRVPGHPPVRVHVDRADTFPLRTGVVVSTQATVCTVEHLLAALWIEGLDDVILEVTGGEIPLLDGSAASFLAGLRQAGRQALPAPRHVWKVVAPVEVRWGDPDTGATRLARLDPLPDDARDGLVVDVTLDVPNPGIGRQVWTGRIDPAHAASELAPARTFALERDVQAMLDAGYIRGADATRALTYDAAGATPRAAPFWTDEPVRHKTLDILGDLVLAGADIRGHLRVERPGHLLTHALLRAALATPGVLRKVAETVPAPASCPVLWAPGLARPA